MPVESALMGVGFLGGGLCLVVAAFFLFQYGYRTARKQAEAQQSLKWAKRFAIGIGGGFVLLLLGLLCTPDMNAGHAFFLLGFVACPIAAVVAIFFWMHSLYWKKKDAELGAASRRKAKYAAAGFGAGIVLLICGIAQTPGAPPPPVLTPEERAQQKAYDQQAQYEEWMAWQASEKKKAEDAAQQDAYDKQAQYEEWVEWQKGQELQEAYDKQAQYEEWMAWKKDQELQEAYDKQAQYEEWIAWQASEREKAAAEENKYTRCTADQMLADYDNNALRAKKHYKGTYVKVTGRVKAIFEEGFLLEALDDDAFYNSAIRCTVDSSNVLMSLNNEQTVVVYGKIDDVGDVVATMSFGGADVTGYDITVQKVQK